MPLRIVADNGEYMLQNKGDLALIQVTVERLLEHWPDARVGVLTFQQRMLRAYFPRAEPIAFGQSSDWPQPDWFDAVAERVGPAIASRMIAVRRHIAAVRNRSRGVGGTADDGQGGAVLGADPAAQPVPAAVESADLVIAIGGGYMADVDRLQVHRTLNLLERAVARGVPTAMLGQGLGPLDDEELLVRARAVLPRVDVIAVREARVGPALLAHLGVAPERVMVTGDDAIELAHRAASASIGARIGVCLRATSYAPVGQGSRDVLRSAIQRSARQLEAGLAPLFISEYESEDRRATLPLVADFPDVAKPLGRHASADAVAARVATCRVLVTGAYHLGVFALSQGIPVVGLTASRYSEDKMRGLGVQFGTGVTVVDLEGDRLAERVGEAISRVWHEAPAMRSELFAAARRQIQASRAAFDRVYRLADRRR